MFKKSILSAVATVALTGVCLTAHAQLVPVEIEGPLSAYVADAGNRAGTMTVMGMNVRVDQNTAFVSPTGDRLSAPFVNANGNTVTMPINQWIRGARYDGRRLAGLLGGTVIVTGEWDPTALGGAGAIVASEVFSDIAENVILGVITANNCETPACDGENDFIRGNNGPAFLPNKDPRLTANPIVDAGLFALDLTGADLVGTSFGGEGYYSDNKIDVPGSAVQEQALIYWAFELGENRPDLLADKASHEISVLRVRCTEGGRLEVRGWVHTPLNEDGTAQPGFNVAEGSIEAVMRIGATTVRFEDDGPTPDGVTPGYGIYRLRADVTTCAPTVDVNWLPQGGGAPLASALDVSVDRLREE